MAEFWGLRGLPVIKITVDRQVRVCLHVMQSERKNAARHANIVNAFVVRLFCVCDGQKFEDPKLRPMADDAITQSGIGGLGSLVYICEAYTCS